MWYIYYHLYTSLLVVVIDLYIEYLEALGLYCISSSILCLLFCFRVGLVDRLTSKRWRTRTGPPSLRSHDRWAVCLRVCVCVHIYTMHILVYMYIYIYIHVCVCACVCVCVCIYIYIYILTHSYVHTHIYVYTHTCAHSVHIYIYTCQITQARAHT